MNFTYVSLAKANMPSDFVIRSSSLILAVDLLGIFRYVPDGSDNTLTFIEAVFANAQAFTDADIDFFFGVLSTEYPTFTELALIYIVGVMP